MVHSSHENTEYGITELWGSTCWSLQNWTFQALKGRVRSKHFGWRSHCLDWWQIIFDSLLRNILVWRLGEFHFTPRNIANQSHCGAFCYVLRLRLLLDLDNWHWISGTSTTSTDYLASGGSNELWLHGVSWHFMISFVLQLCYHYTSYQQGPESTKVDIPCRVLCWPCARNLCV